MKRVHGGGITMLVTSLMGCHGSRGRRYVKGAREQRCRPSTGRYCEHVSGEGTLAEVESELCNIRGVPEGNSGLRRQ